MRDMFAVRGLLEPLAARLAAGRARDGQLASLRALLDEARLATEAGDLDKVADLNSALHTRVVELSGNLLLRQFSLSMYRHVHWVFRLGAATRATHSWKEHVRLVEALEAHDPDAAELAAAEHVHAAEIAAIDRSAAEGSHSGEREPDRDRER
jgi:DNA-binding GntR family transcriptional regulator